MASNDLSQGSKDRNEISLSYRLISTFSSAYNIPVSWSLALKCLKYLTYSYDFEPTYLTYLTITPQAGIGSESIAHEAEGRMGNCLRGHCFSKIQLVGQKYRDKKMLAS